MSIEDGNIPRNAGSYVRMKAGRKASKNPKEWMSDAGLSVSKINPYMRPSGIDNDRYEVGSLRRTSRNEKSLEAKGRVSGRFKLGLSKAQLEGMTWAAINELAFKSLKRADRVCRICLKQVKSQGDGVLRGSGALHHLCAAKKDDRDRKIRAIMAINYKSKAKPQEGA